MKNSLIFVVLISLGILCSITPVHARKLDITKRVFVMGAHNVNQHQAKLSAVRELDQACPIRGWFVRDVRHNLWTNYKTTWVNGKKYDVEYQYVIWAQCVSKGYVL